jgi:hypothetical protein
VILAAACTERPQGIDLIHSKRAWVAESSAGGLDPHEVRVAVGRPQRIRDVVRASLPAAPPSRFRFVTDVPADGRLVLAAGIPGRHQGESAVEFVVNVRHRGRETTVLSHLVDPANREADRRWVPLEADLSEHAGTDVEIVLETRGFDGTGPKDRAFWGTPTITTAEHGETPLVVVYLVDTLRADHLPLYGYARDTAPELSRFAKDAVVFDQAIAPSSWTKPSVASLFTSLLPRDHGCVQFYTPLDPALVTLAERLRERGYGTGAVVVNQLVLAKNMHFDQGFDHFAAPPSPHRAEQSWTPPSVHRFPPRQYVPLRARWTRHALPAAAPVRRRFELPGRGAPSPSSPTTWYRATSTASWPSTTGRSPTATGSSGAFCGGCGSAGSTTGRRSCSCPTTGRSSSTTAAGCTGTPSSTSWCACPWS